VLLRVSAVLSILGLTSLPYFILVFSIVVMRIVVICSMLSMLGY